MGRTLAAVLVGTLILMGLLSSMLSARLISLQTELEERSAMDYDLSSKVIRRLIRTRFSGRDTIVEEARTEVLASSLFSEEDMIGQSSWPLTAIPGRMIIRTMNFFVGDETRDPGVSRRSLKALRQAFYYQRMQRYQLAVQTYGRLLEDQDLSETFLGFALLNRAFCHLMLGEYDIARSGLNLVRKDFAGTRAAQDADVLLELIAFLENQRGQAEQFGEDDVRRARYLAANRNCREALMAFQKTGLGSKSDRLARARCLENTGDLKEAAIEYAEIASSEGDRDLARKANRRLLLLGYVYDSGEDIKKLASERAAALGDSEVLAEVRESATARTELPDADPAVPEEEPELVIELDTAAKEEAKPRPVPVLPQKPAPADTSRETTVLEQPRSEEPEKKTRTDEKPEFSVVLTDGRRMEATEVKIQSGLLLVRVKAGFPVSAPLSTVQSVQSPAPFAISIDGRIHLLVSTIKREGEQLLLISGEEPTILQEVKR